MNPFHRSLSPSARLAGVTLAALGGLALLGACSGDDDEAAPPTDPEVSEEVTTTVSGATTTAAAAAETATTSAAPAEPTTTTTTTTTTTIPRQPLNGVPLEEGESIIDRPALAVKIDNLSAARRNHSGLANADIVFEEIVEGDITRFAAVFHTQGSDPVGPIRSGRSQDVGILTSFNEPLFAWSGGNPGVTRLIAESTLTDLNAVRGGEGYYRGPGTAPNNLYNSTDRLWEQTPEDHPGPPPQQYAYLPPGDVFDGDPVESVQVFLGGVNIEWVWDAEEGVFRRFQSGSEHIDVVNGPITADNVVIMAVEYIPSVIDTRSPEAQTVGNGRVFIFSNGSVVEARWSRSSIEVPIRFHTVSDVDIALTPGNTWIELAEGLPSGDPAFPDLNMEITPG